jgi:polyhydroxyalkanoate synthesis regulator phasin
MFSPKTEGTKMAKKTKKLSKTKKTVSISVKKSSGKVEFAKRSIGLKIEKINRVINRLEGEVEGLIKRIVKQGERSRKELRKNFDDLLSRVRGTELISLATETRDEIEREVRRLAEDIVNVVKEIELVPSRIDFLAVFNDARRNFNNLVEHLSDNNFIQHAKSTVNQSRKELLGMLSIPTQDEVEKLERKIISLEKRLSNISRKAA